MTQITVGENETTSLDVNNDDIALATGDSVSVDGEGNVVKSEADDLVTLSGTNSSFDTIYVSDDTSTSNTSNGQPAGVLLLADTQAWVSGSRSDGDRRNYQYKRKY